jgi:PAS domain S-box-containing protein
MKNAVKILLLEDSATDAELVQRHLRKNYTAASVFWLAMSRQDFITALDTFKPDVVLADNSLPQFAATDALEIVKKLENPVPFIMVTGTVSEEFAATIIREGADDYILKDRLIRLPAAIDAAILRHRQEKEKRKALDKLVESEENYRSLVERISDGFLALDTNWYITYINPVAEQLLGRPGANLTGKNIWDEFPAAINRVFFNAFHTAMQQQQNLQLTDYSIVAGRWFEGTAYPSPTGLSVYFRDVTQQKEAQEKIRKSEEKYRVFIERITDAFVSLDSNWCYTYLNPQAGELMKINPATLIGKNIWEVFPDVVGSETYKAFYKAMQEQHYISNTDYYAPLDLWYENYIYPSADGISVFIRDVTEKKGLEKELLEQERKAQVQMTAVAIAAEEKERNAIGIDLHDNVNQILVGTNVFLALLRDNPEKVPELAQICIDNIKLAINENRKIAHELVTPDIEGETLLFLVERLRKNMLHPAGIRTDFLYENFNEHLLSDDQKLAIYRILQEQCSNILKYAKATTVSVTLITEYNVFLMKIRDNGQGMTVDKKNKGIGLQNIAGRLSVFDGHMTITSSPGQGFLLEAEMPLQPQQT